MFKTHATDFFSFGLPFVPHLLRQQNLEISDPSCWDEARPSEWITTFYSYFLPSFQSTSPVNVVDVLQM